MSTKLKVGIFIILLFAGLFLFTLAEATSKELMLKAWAVPGADSFVKVEVSKNLGTAFSNIKGYLPSDMKSRS